VKQQKETGYKKRAGDRSIEASKGTDG